MSEYRLDVMPDFPAEVVQNFNSHSLGGFEFVGLFNKLGLFKSSEYGSLASGSLNPTVDAFGRQRTSEVFTLGDYKHIYAIDNNFSNFITASADIVYNVNRSTATLSVAAISSSRAVHQTKMYHNYMPGKSQVIFSSFVFGVAQTGVIKRTGYYDDYNGIFLEQDQTGSLQLVIRSSTNGTGSLTEERVKQENWNVNKLLSGDFVLDVTKTQLFYIDFQWLAVGRVRCGFVHKGNVVICHTFDHTNILDKPYMSNPNLPVRCEVRNTGAQAGSMEQICAMVGSEGGYNESGVAWELSSPELRTVTSGSTLPVIAIRLKNSYNGLPNRSYVRVTNVSAFTEDQTSRYNLVKLASGSMLTTSSAWISVDNNSLVEYNVSATALTGGQSLIGGFIFAGGTGGGNNIAGQAQTPGVDAKINYISQNINSTDSEIYVVTMKNMTSTNTDVGCSIMWKEVY